MPSTRRHFLQKLGLGVGALSLPFGGLVSRSVAQAQTSAAEQPLRLLLVFSPNGTAHDLWRPKATPDGGWSIDFPGSILAPLIPFKEKMLVLDGVDFKVLYDHGSSGHEGGPCTLWTGSPMVDVDGGQYPVNASIDQVLAAELGQTTALPSLELGVNMPAGGVHQTFSFGPGGARIPHMHNPVEVFDRVFGGIANSPEADAVGKTLARKKSLLDFIHADTQRLQDRLAGDERVKLEAHLDAIRGIETKLAAQLAAANTCVVPTKPYFTGEGWLDDKWVRQDENIPAMTELQIDLLVETLRCDLTRFATLDILYASPFNTMPWMGLGNVHSDIAHAYDPDNPEIVAALADVQRWYAEQLAYLLGKMDAIDEGNGTMLDNTIVVWGNELGDPSGHSSTNVPFVVFGGGGKIPLNRHLKLSTGASEHWSGNYDQQTAHNGLLVGLMHAFGFTDVQTFGHPDYVGVLPGLFG